MTKKHIHAEDLTLDEQASLTSGEDLWHLQSISSHDIPGYMITDGPHGLRKAADSPTDTNNAVPATCFPPAAGMSSSWDPLLTEKVGQALAEECIQEKVAVILGPGVNIKRNPLGGRSFEFWSEDPLVAGAQAAGLVKGVQSKGIGTSLKHFAVNNQETDRLRINARVSERALREIYFPAFEYVVKHAHPWTVMCAYNKLNGIYTSQNSWLLTDVLRKEWGFNGVVMSDWGACHDHVAAIAAGLNLEMPPSHTDKEVVDAVRNEKIKPETLKVRAQELLNLVEKARPAMEIKDYSYDVDAHHDLARQAAQESIVLLKNEGSILPLSEKDHIAVIGEFARTPRYQGGGSSHVRPTKMVSFLDALNERGIKVRFAPGFTLDRAEQDSTLTDEALDAAIHSDEVIVFLGLPEAEESEGHDRTTVDIPTKQIEVLHKVTAANKRVVVVLSNGSAVSVSPWDDDAAALLEGWLLGQASGQATADVIFGDVCPSGKLAQTIPLRLEDDPSFCNFPGGEGTVDYGEGVFVGYRYYDTVNRNVAYPFGYGLSYTTFNIYNLTVKKTSACSATVTVTISNTGSRRGAEVVQVYIAPKNAPVSRPLHELKAFKRVELEPGESKIVTFELKNRAFAYWSEQLKDWHISKGDYEIQVGSSSHELPCTQVISLDGDDKHLPLDEFSLYEEWQRDPIGAPIIQKVEQNASEHIKKLLANPAVQEFIPPFPLTMLAAFIGEDGRSVLNQIIQEYKKALN
jgi:beta-glucosidase